MVSKVFTYLDHQFFGKEARLTSSFFGKICYFLTRSIFWEKRLGYNLTFWVKFAFFSTEYLLEKRKGYSLTFWVKFATVTEGQFFGKKGKALALLFG